MDHFSKCAQICREFFFSNLFSIFFSNYFFSFIFLNYFLIFFFLNFFFHFFCFNFFFSIFFLNFLFISFFVLILPQKKIFKNVFKTALSNLSKNAFSNLLHQKINFINFFENTFSNCSLKNCCLSLTLLKNLWIITFIFFERSIQATYCLTSMIWVRLWNSLIVKICNFFNMIFYFGFEKLFIIDRLARSAPQILSIKDECTFFLLSFLE